MNSTEQVNFLLGSVAEFMKLWHGRQEATFNLSCKDGEANVNFSAILNTQAQDSKNRISK